MSRVKTCRVSSCGVVLIEGQNWAHYRAINNRYICDTCEKARAGNYRKTHKAETRFRDAKRVDAHRIEACCAYCGKKFMANTLNKKPQRYCSKSCWYQRNDTGGSKSKICGWCGKTFSKIMQSWRDWNVQKFCSLRCAYDAMPPAARPQKICETCHITFFKHKNIPSKTWARQRFCSPKCRANSPESKELLRKNGRFVGDRNAKLGYLPSMSSMAGKIGGRKNVESGRIFNLPAAQITYGLCGINMHKHRSKPEILLCRKLQLEYGATKVNASVIFGGKELDFVISDDPSDSLKWAKVIETHCTVWDIKNGVSDYYKTRTDQLRQLGITCQIEIIIQK